MIFTFFFSVIFAFQISGDTEAAVKLLDKSWIKNVQVRVFSFYRLLFPFPLDPQFVSQSDLPVVCLSQGGQTCCLMRLVLRFYIERVFSNYASSQPQDQRCSSSLANSFVTIRRSIHKCVSQCRQLRRSVIHVPETKSITEPVTITVPHSVQNCQCSEETQRTVDSLHAEFNKVRVFAFKGRRVKCTSDSQTSSQRTAWAFKVVNQKYMFPFSFALIRWCHTVAPLFTDRNNM